MTPEPHERLAAAIEERRGELGLSLREVAELAGITGETLRAVRKGSNYPSPLTKRGIERALRWAPGSVDAILSGGGPTIREQRAPVGQAVETDTAGPAVRIHDVRLTVPSPPAEDEEDDPKMRRAMELMAEAQALLAEIQRERREGA